MKIRYDIQAKRDFLDIKCYLLAHSSAASANRVRLNITKRINQLAHAPYLGVVTSEPSIRILAPTAYPYRIYYTVTETAIVVLHIRHTARQSPDLKELK